MFSLFWFLFETGSLCVPLAGLGHEIRLGSNLESIYLFLPVLRLKVGPTTTSYTVTILFTPTGIKCYKKNAHWYCLVSSESVRIHELDLEHL